MRDIYEETQTMLAVARQGWEPLNDEWSRITISASHEPGPKRFGKAYEEAARALVTFNGGNPQTDIRIDNSPSNIVNGNAAMTIEMKTSVLEKVKKLQAHPYMIVG